MMRVGDDGIRGTYAKHNGSFTLKPVSGGYMGNWKDDTGSGAMALLLDGDSFRASLSRGSEASASRNQPATRSSGAAVGAIIEPSGPSLSRITGLPPGERLTGKCVP
jgi:hypothetical protein